MRARRSTDRMGMAPPLVCAFALAAMLGATMPGCAAPARDSRRGDRTSASGDAGARVLEPAVSGEAAERERAARRAVQDARAFLIQERPEAALRATTRGLFAQPDDPALLRERARALEALGRDGEAAEARAKADRIDPPPPPLPEGPLPGAFDDLLVVLQAPELDFGSERAVHAARSAIELKPALVERLSQRLPGVAIVDEAEAPTATVPAARSWLESHDRSRLAGVRIVRAFCGESVKDGRYAVATIHRTEASAGERRGEAAIDDEPVTDDRRGASGDADAPVVDGPVRWSGARGEEDATDCARIAMHRAIERWLEAPFFSSESGDASSRSGDASSRSGDASSRSGDASSRRGDASPRRGDASSQGGDAEAVHESPMPTREAILALLPGLHDRVRAEHVSARRALFVGDLERARAAYERAAVLDPEDSDVAAHLEEIDATIALNRELAQIEAERQQTDERAHSEAAAERGGWLPAELSPAQRAALESQLESERGRRDDLLATLATVSGDRRSAHVPEAALRTTELLDLAAPGAQRALAQLGASAGAHAHDEADAAGRLVVKTLHAPSGALLARYYFDAAALEGEAGAEPPPPILVEEDVSGDGILDRWTAYREGRRAAVWEERREEGLPDLHVRYADDGRALVRLELDDGLDGQPDRIYEYEAGVLVRASRDTNGDGRLNRFDRFDAEGRVALREEDVTGDRRIDVRSTFVNGRLVKRELMEPDTVDAQR